MWTLNNDDRVMEVEGFEAREDFELATSKPLNSSRAVMNRRFNPA